MSEERDEDNVRMSNERRGVSRRKVLAGGLLLIGGSSQFLSSTKGHFHDTESASDSIYIDGDPNLDYQITDESKNNKAEFAVSYQVEWVSDFDYIEITVDSIPDGQYNSDPGGSEVAESYTNTSNEGTFSTSSFGGREGDTFEFILEVYEEGNSDPVIREITTDEADGEGDGDGDFGNENSPELKWAIVEDQTENNTGSYTVYYEIEKIQNFGEIRVKFNDNDKNTATKTKTNQSSPNGQVSYSEGGTEDHAFDIVIEVLNQNGLVVDSTTISDVANGIDPSTYGTPRQSDSPTLDSFTVTDDTDNSGAAYSLTYQTSNTSQFGGARITFENQEKDSATETITTAADQPSGSVSYNTGGTDGHEYKIIVEILETRNGITFPIDSGSLSHTAGEDGTKSWS